MQDEMITLLFQLFGIPEPKKKKSINNPTLTPQIFITMFIFTCAEAALYETYKFLERLKH